MSKKIITKKRIISSKGYWILFSLAILMIFMDGMVTTPIALVCIDGAYEANIWHKHFSDSLGVKYFFYSTPISMLLLFLLTQGTEKISYDWLKSSKKYFKYYHWPTYILLLLVIVLFGSVVINNLEIISHGIT